MTSIFWDSSALVKIYHSEKDSNHTVDLFSNPKNAHFASVISRVEVFHALGRLFREKKLVGNEFNIALKRFLWDSDTNIKFIGLDSVIVDEAGNLALDHAIKSLEAIIIATLRAFHATGDKPIFLTYDIKQIKLAEQLGYEIFSP